MSTLETPETEPATTILVDQPTKKPTRKVRIAGYVAAALTIATYASSAIAGDSVISQEAFFNAVGVLAAAIIPVISAYLAKEEVVEEPVVVE
jgi:hypothetical protein